jgi:hypothetical protein
VCITQPSYEHLLSLGHDLTPSGAIANELTAIGRRRCRSYNRRKLIATPFATVLCPERSPIDLAADGGELRWAAASQAVELFRRGVAGCCLLGRYQHRLSDHAIRTEHIAV